MDRKRRGEVMKDEQKVINEAYRTALYDMFTAVLKFLSVEDRQWLMPKLKAYSDACNESIKR